MNHPRPAPQPDEGSVLLHLSGEYDIYRQDELDRTLRPGYLAEVVVLDMRDVSYIDSTAIALLIRLKKRMSEHGRAIVKIAGPQSNVRRVLELTSLDEILEVYDTLDDALV
jgi:anti-sigma B factor antagonist